MLQEIAFWHSISMTKEESYIICVWGKKREKIDVGVVRCFLRGLFLQPVKGAIRWCFTGMTRGWKGDTGRKFSKNQGKKSSESGKYVLVALSSWWIILLLCLILTDLWFGFLSLVWKEV